MTALKQFHLLTSINIQTGKIIISCEQAGDFRAAVTALMTH